MKHYLGLIVIASTVLACSSKSQIQSYREETVLSTASNKKQPDWADETKSFWIEGGKVYSLGLAQIRGDERPEAGMRIAQNNAKANFARAVENRMEFIFQNAEENATYENTAAKFIGSEVSNLTTHSIRSEGRWWKRFEQSNDDGSRRIYYKLYALEVMPEPDFKRAVHEAVNKGVKRNHLSDSFQKQVDRQWDRFVEGPTTEAN